MYVYRSSVVRLIGCIGFVLLQCAALAQQRAATRLSEAEGLPGSTVFCLLQARDGKIWLGTDFGLCRYDGHRFEVWGPDQGLPGREVVHIYEDRAGRLWAGTFSGEVGFVWKGKLHHAGNTSWIPRLSGVPVTITELEQGRFCIGTTREVHLFDSTAHEVIFRDHGVGRQRFLLDRGEALPTVLGASGDAFRWDRHMQRTLPDGCEAALPTGWAALLGNMPEGKAIPATLKSIRRDAAFLADALARVEATCRDCEVVTLCYDRDVSLWVGTRGHGLLRVDRATRQVEHLLQGSAINAVLVGREGTRWVATQNEGLYVLSARDGGWRTFGREDGLLSAEIEKLDKDDRGNLYIGYSSGQLSRLDRSFGLRHHLPVPEGSGSFRLSDMNVLTDGNVLLATPHSLCWVRDFGGQPEETGREIRPGRQQPPPGQQDRSTWRFLQGYAVKDQVVLADSHWAVSTHVGLFECRPRQGGVACQSLIRRRLEAIAFEPKTSRWWLSTVDSLLWLRDGKLLRPPYQEALGSRVQHLAHNHGDGMWAGTGTNGIFLLRDSSFVHISRADGLPSNVCTALRAEAPGIAWAGTPAGLVRLDLRVPDRPKLRVCTVAEGLPDNYIRDVLRIGDTLWVATRKGLAFFPVRQAATAAPPPCLRIDGIAIRGRDTTVQAHYALPYWQNSIAIHVFDSCFRADRYAFRCLGQDTAWTALTEPEIVLPFLAAGEDYDVQVRAAGPQGNWSETLSIGLSIHAPFYRTAWFPVLICTVLLGVAIAVLLLRQRQRNRIAAEREAYLRQLSEVRISVLRARMNPHFIFNCLNAIQQLVLEATERETLDFVAKFAALMRKTLDQSQMDLVPLQAELELCRMYLEMETLRLSDGFAYSVEVAPELDTAVALVPTMLFQPFIENAIWHGLMEKRGDRQLHIALTALGAEYCISITDNGVGRRQAARNRVRKGATHKSYAYANFRERIALLNATIPGAAFRMQVTDLTDGQGVAAGTRVQIYFPYLTDPEPFISIQAKSPA